MEKSKILKFIIYLLLAIGILEVGILTWALRPSHFFLWVTLGTILVVCIYLGVTCLKLLKLSADKIDKL